MVAARKRLRKRSGTSGGARQPRPLTFFVDECLGRKAVPEALRAHGHRVVLHCEQFVDGVDDAVWLTALREHRREWVVLTKDKQIRKRPLEKNAYISSGVRVFALTAADLTSEKQAEAFVAGLRRIVRIAAMAGPYIARVTALGNVKIVERPKPGRRKKHRMQPR